MNQSKVELKKYIDDITNTHNEFYNKSGIIHMRNNPKRTSGFVRKSDREKYNTNNNININYNTRIPVINYIQNTLMNNFNIRTVWDKLSKLYIINYDVNKSDLTNNICKQSNGVIFEKETNNIVCFIYNAIRELDESVYYQKYLEEELSDTESSKFSMKVQKLRNVHNYNLDKVNSQVDYKMLTDDELLTEDDIDNPENSVNNKVEKTSNSQSNIDNMFLSEDEKEIAEDLLGDNFKNYTVQELYDGTLIKLFYYDGEWCTATNKCTDASRSRWLSERSYDELFRDIDIDYDSLNTNHCYAFILLHPENRMLCKYNRPTIVHVGTFDIPTLSESTESYFSKFEGLDLLGKHSNLVANSDVGSEVGSKIAKNHYFNPRNVEFNDLTGLLRSFDEMNEKFNNNKYVFPGYFLVNNTTGDRIKIMNPKFRYMMNIKGNSRNMVYRICELMKTKNEFEEFVYYFPEYSHEVDTAKKISDKVGKYVYNNWFDMKYNDKQIMNTRLYDIVKNFDNSIHAYNNSNMNEQPNDNNSINEFAKSFAPEFAIDYFTSKNLIYYYNNVI